MLQSLPFEQKAQLLSGQGISTCHPDRIVGFRRFSSASVLVQSSLQAVAEQRQGNEALFAALDQTLGSTDVAFETHDHMNVIGHQWNIRVLFLCLNFGQPVIFVNKVPWFSMFLAIINDKSSKIRCWCHQPSGIATATFATRIFTSA